MFRNINVNAPLLFSGYYHIKLGNINESSRSNHNSNQQKFKPKDHDIDYKIDKASLFK